MATASVKKGKAGTVPVPECPICMEPMCVPIFQCRMGHSLCNTCTKTMLLPLCPICRQDMTQMRNWQLEEQVAKAQVACPNKSNGCVYVIPQSELYDHLKECIFRSMDCPLNVFGKCSWNGELKKMSDHFHECHPGNCNINTDSEVVINDININEDDRFVYLVNQGKLIFILTIKLDVLQKMSYWTIQHIGSKKSAQQHIYEIHVSSLLDNRRKVVFIDHCFNDGIKADDVFRMGKCAMLPLNALAHFVKAKKLSFRFFIKKTTTAPKNKNEPNVNAKPESEKSFKPFNKGQGSKPKGVPHKKFSSINKS